MSFRLVETYSIGAAEHVTIEGVAYPRDCLIEDQDGIRILITSSVDIPVGWWTQAHQAGCSMLVCLAPTNWLHCTTEDFIDFRDIKPIEKTFGLPLLWCLPAARVLGYRAFLDYRKMSQDLTRTQDAGAHFVNVHNHTEYSALDGFSKVDECVDIALEHGDPAVCVTDHGVCAAHHGLQVATVKKGIKPVFGIEAYFVADRFVKEGGQNYYHLILWAMNQQGLFNLWAASTEANKTGFYYKPRMDWEILERFGEGIMASTGCLRGPLSEPLSKGEEEQANLNLGRLMQIFPDRLYIELHCNQLPQQIEVNHALVEMSQTHSLPVIAAVDSHYPCASDYDVHQVWLSAQMFSKKDSKGGEEQEDSGLFAGHQDYHLMTRSEVHAKLDYLDEGVVKEALDNTVTMAARCDAEVAGKSDPPIYSRPAFEGEPDASRRERDIDTLLKVCLGNWDRKVKGKTNPESVYEEQFEFEMQMYIDKDFVGYFDMVLDYTRAAKAKPMIMGPSRGSGGASLVAYLADITEIDPIEADLDFARFMTKGRPSNEPPDFDLDFPTSQRPWLTDWMVERWGTDHVVRVGTHIRLKNKGVIRDLARVLTHTNRIEIYWPDIDAICKIIEEEEADSAGLGKPWDAVMAATETVMEPYIKKYPLMFEYAERMVGRLKSYGKHAAGMVIAPDRVLTNTLPMREGDDGQMVAEPDMDALAALGLLKFDLLTLRTLDTLQMCLDLIKERHGIHINVYDWRAEYTDADVWDAICDGQTMGLFQVETKAVTRLTKRFQPRSLADLANVITLVRPGPQRSGLTEMFIRRRNGDEEVTFPDPRLEKALAKSFGCIVYQEDIIAVCRLLAGYDDVAADRVRKVLGKKKVEAVAEEGRKFIAAVVERGMALEDAEFLWNQMKEFAKYSFNRAHAWAYAVLGFWTAWFKVHYPAEFLTAVLSTVDKKRIPDFVSEARKMGFAVLPPDVNLSGADFRCYDDSVRYSLQGIKGIGPSAVEPIVANQPYTSFEDFRAKMKGTGCHSDHIRLLAAIGGFDSLHPNRRELEVMLDREASGEADRCVHKDDTACGPNGLPCVYDWDNEPVELTSSGRPKKRKDPPKRCTKACRNYTHPGPMTITVEPYTDDDIRDREMELLDVWLSSTPFDRIDPADLDLCFTAEEIDHGPSGEYMVAGIVRSKRSTIDKHNRPMGFMTMLAQTSNIDVTVFHKPWEKYSGVIKPGTLCFAIITKTDRGLNLENLMPCS